MLRCGVAVVVFRNGSSSEVTARCEKAAQCRPSATVQAACADLQEAYSTCHDHWCAPHIKGPGHPGQLDRDTTHVRNAVVVGESRNAAFV